MNTDHIPAPAGHAPRLRALTDPRVESLAFYEHGNEEGGWIRTTTPMEVRQ